MQNAQICVVDDEEYSRVAAVAALQEAGYQPVECDSGAACLDWLAFAQQGAIDLPHLLLLDIEMPGPDGYETCRQLRAAGHDDLAVIFVSAHDDLDSRLAAYEAGGNDFIAKPIWPEELARKVDLALTHQQHLRALRQDLSSAEEMTTLALSSLDEMGSVQKFLRSLLGCREQETLARLVIDAFAAYGCQAVVQLRSNQEAMTWSAQGVASPLEGSIIEQSRQMGRLFQFSRRMVVNYERMSVLVSQLPVDDEELTGRIRDHAAVIAEAADAAMDGIALRLDVLARAQRMQALSRHSGELLGRLQLQYRQQQKLTRTDLEAMVDEVEHMYYRLGLSREQEELISDTVRSATGRVLQLFALGESFDEQFNQILQELDEAGQVELEAQRTELTQAEVWI